ELLPAREADLDPCVTAATRRVRGSAALRDHTFKAKAAHGRGDLGGRPWQRVGKQDAGVADHRSQRVATLVERQTRQVAAVEVQQVEGVVDDRESFQAGVVQGLE